MMPKKSEGGGGALSFNWVGVLKNRKTTLGGKGISMGLLKK